MSDNNKQSAIDFLQLVIAGKIDQAYQQYVDMSGKHHNVFYPAGFAVLQQGMNDNEQQFPHKEFTVKNVLADGDMVAVHSHLVLDKTNPGMVVVHIFRFQNGKIVELWDCSQPIPPDSPNTDGAF